MDNETRFWIVVGIMAFGAAVQGASRITLWAIFHFGAKGKLKVRVVLPEEKVEGSNDA